MDRLRIIPSNTYLTDEAADRLTTVDGFRRKVTTAGKNRKGSLILSLNVGGYEFLRIITHRLDDGRWRVSCIDVNLPAHLHGHNGRAIRTPHDLALALTRVRHFVSKVTRPECWGRIIPGIGRDNLSFLQYVETMVQMQDPGHSLILGSHVASMRGQHGRPLIRWGCYTRFIGSEVALTLYDKSAQRKKVIVDPDGIDATRLECTVKNCRRLAKEAAATRIYTGKPGEVVRTLSLDTSYAILRRNLGKLSGFGGAADAALAGLCSTSRHLLLGLGGRVAKPHMLDQLLEHYLQTSAPGKQTFAKVSKEVRGYALAMAAPDVLALLPEDIDQLRWSDVRMPAVEKEFSILLRDMDAPMTPAPDILEAWSATTFLPTKPSGFELSGPVAPGLAMPWKTTL